MSKLEKWKEMKNKYRIAITALFSLLSSGLGQLYNGQWKKSLGFFFISIALLLLSPILLFPTNPKTIFFLFISWGTLFVIFRIYVLIDAIIFAYRASLTPKKKYQHWGVYFIFFILTQIFDSFILEIQHKKWFEAYVIPTESMIPTLWKWDKIYLNKKPIRSSEIKLGDILAFQNPSDRTVVYVKRVIGIPGDQLEFRNGVLWRNGEEQKCLSEANESNIKEMEHSERKKVCTEHLGGREHAIVLDSAFDVQNHKNPQELKSPFIVPVDHVFMAGDNRDASNDSRFFGPVPIENIVGRPLFVWFSYDSTTKRIHWDRIGSMSQ